MPICTVSTPAGGIRGPEQAVLDAGEPDCRRPAGDEFDPELVVPSPRSRQRDAAGFQTADVMPPFCPRHHSGVVQMDRQSHCWVMIDFASSAGVTPATCRCPLSWRNSPRHSSQPAHGIDRLGRRTTCR